MSKIASCLLAGVALMPIAARAQQSAQPLSPIDVYAHRYSSDDGEPLAKGKPTPNATIISRDAIANLTPRTNDTASLLENTAGVSLYGAGAISSLPVIHGLEDERNAVVLGGVPITAACANHMNPPLSYIDPAAVGADRGADGQRSGQQGRRFRSAARSWSRRARRSSRPPP